METPNQTPAAPDAACPFCGSAIPGKIVTDGLLGTASQWSCGNRDCGAAGPIRLSSDESRTAWNARTPDPAAVADRKMVEALESCHGLHIRVPNNPGEDWRPRLLTRMFPDRFRVRDEDENLILETYSFPKAISALLGTPVAAPHVRDAKTYSIDDVWAMVEAAYLESWPDPQEFEAQESWLNSESRKKLKAEWQAAQAEGEKGKS